MAETTNLLKIEVLHNMLDIPASETDYVKTLQDTTIINQYADILQQISDLLLNQQKEDVKFNSAYEQLRQSLDNKQGQRSQFIGNLLLLKQSFHQTLINIKQLRLLTNKPLDFNLQLNNFVQNFVNITLFTPSDFQKIFQITQLEFNKSISTLQFLTSNQFENYWNNLLFKFNQRTESPIQLQTLQELEITELMLEEEIMINVHTPMQDIKRQFEHVKEFTVMVGEQKYYNVVEPKKEEKTVQQPLLSTSYVNSVLEHSLTKQIQSQQNQSQQYQSQTSEFSPKADQQLALTDPLKQIKVLQQKLNLSEKEIQYANNVVQSEQIQQYEKTLIKVIELKSQLVQRFERMQELLEIINEFVLTLKGNKKQLLGVAAELRQIIVDKTLILNQYQKICGVAWDFDRCVINDKVEFPLQFLFLISKILKLCPEDEEAHIKYLTENTANIVFGQNQFARQMWDLTRKVTEQEIGQKKLDACAQIYKQNHTAIDKSWNLIHNIQQREMYICQVPVCQVPDVFKCEGEYDFKIEEREIIDEFDEFDEEPQTNTPQVKDKKESKDKKVAKRTPAQILKEIGIDIKEYKMQQVLMLNAFNTIGYVRSKPAVPIPVIPVDPKAKINTMLKQIKCPNKQPYKLQLDLASQRIQVSRTKPNDELTLKDKIDLIRKGKRNYEEHKVEMFQESYKTLTPIKINQQLGEKYLKIALNVGQICIKQKRRGTDMDNIEQFKVTLMQQLNQQINREQFGQYVQILSAQSQLINNQLTTRAKNMELIKSIELDLYETRQFKIMCKTAADLLSSKSLSQTVIQSKPQSNNTQPQSKSLLQTNNNQLTNSQSSKPQNINEPKEKQITNMDLFKQRALENDKPKKNEPKENEAKNGAKKINVMNVGKIQK
ncbi:Conserved_hypothetical protein [Hexamita inflata]|uniref:Uncharacterized protein n=1 Tax=Hexamita inflata TaxID=28002 RepID=A0AA86PJN1_9EUKA|nr:Conserved hypothetical protein [Hexamita inflata]CAI9962945.1 Conserved hypothetical protein [Hexamita inflata]